MQKGESLTDFQSKEKESSPSSIGVQSSRFPTEVEYITKVDTKPAPKELNNMGNRVKRRFWNNRGKEILKVENEKKGKTHYSSKKELHTILKLKGNNSTISIKFE